MNEWISIKDKIPNNDEWVIAWDKKDIYLLKFNVDQDKRVKNPSYYFSSSDNEDYFDSVTHWMPLPKPPVV